MQKITIAIDGFSSTGKSTVAKQLAKALGYVYVDSGAMYRAVTLFAMQNGFIDEKHFDSNKLIANLNTVEILFKFNNILQDGHSHSIQRKIAWGKRKGQKVLYVGKLYDLPWEEFSGKRSSYIDGFSLHANVAIGAKNRSGLERLCRYTEYRDIDIDVHGDHGDSRTC